MTDIAAGILLLCLLFLASALLGPSGLTVHVNDTTYVLRMEMK